MARLINEALAQGSYAGTPMEDSSEFIVYTSAVDIEKTATPVLWLDGNLAYEVVVKNPDPADPGTPLDNAVMTDIIDPEIAELIDGTVMRNGTLLTVAADPLNPQIGEYAYDAGTGLLTVPLGTLNPGDANAATITFQVRKKT